MRLGSDATGNPNETVAYAHDGEMVLLILTGGVGNWLYQPPRKTIPGPRSHSEFQPPEIDTLKSSALDFRIFSSEHYEKSRHFSLEPEIFPRLFLLQLDRIKKSD